LVELDLRDRGIEARFENEVVGPVMVAGAEGLGVIIGEDDGHGGKAGDLRLFPGEERNGFDNLKFGVDRGPLLSDDRPTVGSCELHSGGKVTRHHGARTSEA